MQLLAGEPFAIAADVVAERADRAAAPRLGAARRRCDPRRRRRVVSTADHGWTDDTRTLSLRFDADRPPFADGRLHLRVDLTDDDGQTQYHSLDDARVFVVYPSDENRGLVRLEGRWSREDSDARRRIGESMSTRTCPDWPDLMELAPELQFKHYTVAEAQLPADALMLVKDFSLSDVAICADLEKNVFYAAHTDERVAEALRQSHWYELREWISAGPPRPGPATSTREPASAAARRARRRAGCRRRARVIAARVSTVPLPMCGVSTTFGSVHSASGTAGSWTKTSRPGADPPGDELLDERVLVDERAARGVHERRAVAQQREPLARDEPASSPASAERGSRRRPPRAAGRRASRYSSPGSSSRVRWW